MPVGALKNRLYHAALPVLGRRCQWNEIHGGSPGGPLTASLRKILRKRRVAGAAIQTIHSNTLTECYTAGNARLAPALVPVSGDTLFRTASVAKLASAVLVFRLQTLGMLDVGEDISAFLGYAVQNPLYPNKAITLGMLLSHTSSIVDSPAYFAAFSASVPLRGLLGDAAAFSTDEPGARFRYSNLAAGMVGCLLEARFGRSLEALAQEYLFEPLGLGASFDMTALDGARIADSYRVLPPGKGPGFNALRRMQTAAPLMGPDPERHYMLASGNLFIIARDMGRLLLQCLSPREGVAAFLDGRSLGQMKTPLGRWPEDAVRMGHGMGLLKVDDPKVSSRTLYGHQGFAYGAVNGCFFSEDGDGFVCLNSGASEERLGHLSLLNRDLIQLFLP